MTSLAKKNEQLLKKQKKLEEKLRKYKEKEKHEEEKKAGHRNHGAVVGADKLTADKHVPDRIKKLKIASKGSSRMTESQSQLVANQAHSSRDRGGQPSHGKTPKLNTLVKQEPLEEMSRDGIDFTGNDMTGQDVTASNITNQDMTN